MTDTAPRARGLVACVAAAAFVLAPPVVAAAQAVFSEVGSTEGVRFYADLEDGGLYYYAPAGVELKARDGEPAFSFLRFRYIGTRTLGDAGSFEGKGLLSFTIRLVTTPENLEPARSALERTLGRRVRLEPLPIVDVRSELIYTAVRSESESAESGTLGSGSSDESGGEGRIWEERTYYITADPLSAAMLWQAYQGGSVILSVNVSVDSRGVEERPVEAGGGSEMVTRTVLADAVPIEASPQRHPELFREIDIEEEMPAAYTFLDVYCYDFQEGPRDDGLWLVDAEVRARGLSGEAVDQRVRFSAEKPQVVKQQVHFSFAVTLDDGYEYRVVRTYASGEREIGDWQRVAYWNGACNVSSGADPSRAGVDARPLDARLLY